MFTLKKYSDVSLEVLTLEENSVEYENRNHLFIQDNYPLIHICGRRM